MGTFLLYIDTPYILRPFVSILYNLGKLVEAVIEQHEQYKQCKHTSEMNQDCRINERCKKKVAM